MYHELISSDTFCTLLPILTWKSDSELQSSTLGAIASDLLLCIIDIMYIYDIYNRLYITPNCHQICHFRCHHRNLIHIAIYIQSYRHPISHDELKIMDAPK